MKQEDELIQILGGKITVQERKHENYEPHGYSHWQGLPKPPYNVAAIIDEDELLLIRKEKYYIEEHSKRLRDARARLRAIKQFLK
jgi:hypothetical protein